MTPAPICYCGLSLFWDHDAERYLCPARYDGTHTAQLENAQNERLARKHTAATSNGSRGGTQRAANLSSEQRSTIARTAARARWSKIGDSP